MEFYKLLLKELFGFQINIKNQCFLIIKILFLMVYKIKIWFVTFKKVMKINKTKKLKKMKKMNYFLELKESK